MPTHKYNIDYTTHKTVSFSQYHLYSQCQHRWYLDYAKKLKTFQPSIHLTFGTSLHEVLQEYFRVMYTKSAKEADKLGFRQMITTRMYENYKSDYQENNSTHFTTRDEIYEFIEDGVAILEWFRKHRSAYFKVKDHELVGIEIPLQQSITPEIPNVILIGSIDLIIRNKVTNEYYIYDIKTSKSGWKDKDKKDQPKVNQVLFYKYFYSKEFNIPEDSINVEFFIVRRKIYENAEFPIKRIQEYKPTQGKIKVKKAYESLAEFVTNVFTPEGQYQEKEYPMNTKHCKWCPYSKKSDLCSKKITTI